jgi:murein peptide amidase A
MIFKEIDPGLSVEGRAIPAFISDVQGNSSKWLYLLAGTHGDEVEGIHVLRELFTWLRTEHALKDMPIVVIPILNMDGYCAGTRVNAHRVDLNRNMPTKDWSPEASQEKYNPGPKPLSEPENQFLVRVLDKYHPGVILSFHTWKPILNYNGDSKDVAEFLAAFNHYPLDGDIGYPTPGSFGSFVPEKYQAGVLTFECPPLADDKTLKDIWKENETGLKEFLRSELLQRKLK